MKKLDVLLVTHDLGFTDSIAIGYLSAIAKQEGHRVNYCSMDKCDLSKIIYESKPDIVGYSANCVGYKKIIEENNKIKQRNCYISIMGGALPTMSQDKMDILEKTGIDALCIGEGEFAFKDFLQKVSHNESFDDIPNIITKHKSNPVRPLIKDLDTIPMPDRDLVLGSTFLGSTPKKTFFTSRGCPFSCAYCCNNNFNELYRGKGKSVRRFSVDRVLREIEDVKSKYNMQFVKFDDDCFALRTDDWLKDFSEQYPKRIGLPFNCVQRLDLMDDTMLSLLKKAGCYSVHLSIDSTSEHVRENVFKRKMRKDIVDRVLLANKYKIKTFVNFMNSAPESNLQDDLATIQMSKEAKITYPAYTTTIPLRGTALFQYCLERGYIPEGYDEADASFTGKSLLNCFSEKEKNTRLNVNLMGAVISKMPYPLDKIATRLIQHIPPNKLFREIHRRFYNHNMEHEIYKLGDSK